MGHATLETRGTTLVADTCWCGIGFAMPESLHRMYMEKGTTVYCPLGHACVRKVSENRKLREALEAEKRRADRAESARNSAELEREWARQSARAYKGQATRLRKRVANGVCPCCHRTFQQLARHMAHKHPGFEATEVEA